MRQSSRRLANRTPGIGIAPALFMLLASCASHEVADVAGHPGPVGTSEVANCQAMLGATAIPVSAELDAKNIRLVSWNVQKNSHLNWERDFLALTGDTDLVLVQELSLREDTINAIDGSRHWSFAPGYQKPGAISGVLTMSRSKPIAQCNFVNFEPLLRTPKATNVTEYGLTSTDETLVVVNIHAVNFSMGLGAFQRQFAQVRDVLQSHDGPIIVSGDFNTWRKRRNEIVADMAAELGLVSLAFDDDYRVTMFGNPLDHIYVRGLSLLDATTERVESSDHNPLSATLRL
ncbi:MAG: endonuclease/exonuclease/phosphatase family protein [Woeseiaceae bacterium]|nr:endonuclease/exonuclease/phosphatase family protein [Woeseiaceae bacterium]